MTSGNVRLNWRGKEVVAASLRALAEIIGEVGLSAEEEAKRELYPGHGEDTKTLKKSIHIAQPGYNWGADDVPAGPGTPERGGRMVKGEIRGEKVFLELGSGMAYAMAQHQGFKHYRSGRFVRGYRYLHVGVEKARIKVSSIVVRNRV